MKAVPKRHADWAAMAFLLAATLLFSRLAPQARSAAMTEAQDHKTLVTGRVTSIEGNPIAKAKLVIIPWEGGSGHHAETLSDSEGRFSLDAQPGNFRLFVYAEGYAAMYRTHDVAEGVNGGWDFTLPQSAHVSGRVLDTKGKPAPGRVLELWALKSGPPPAPGVSFFASGGQGQDATDEHGAFDMRNVAPGKYSVIVYRPSPLGGDRCMEQLPVKGGVLAVSAGERVENFEIRVNPPEDFALAGQVRDARGKPLRRINVDTFIPHGRHWWTHTDEQGAFRIEGLDGMGMTKFRVHFNGVAGAGGYKLVIPDVPLNTKDLIFTVPDKGRIRGTVRNAKSGETVKAYQVSVPVVRLPDSGAVWEEPQVKIERNPDESFSIADVPAGEATVEVRAEGLGAQRFMLKVEADTTNSLECRMLGAAVFAGRTTMDGKPKGVGIIINGEWLNSDSGGNFRFDKFPNGDTTVWFFEHDGWHRSAEVTLKAGETTRLEMEMGGSGEVHGTVILPEEETSCNIRLAARPAPDGWYEFGRPSPEEYVLTYSHVREPGGEYRLRGIPPGRYYLMAGKYRPSMHRSLLGASKIIELKAGESLKVDLDLRQAGQ